jgi:DMSO/TMAO reductase YedYZ heme-binding membrane subunit
MSASTFTADAPPTTARPTALTAAVLAAALAYAIIRYIVFGTVPVSQLPLVIANKAIAVASLVLISACLAIGPLVRLRVLDRRRIAARKHIGLQGFVLGAVHSVLTLAMLSPSINGKLYAGGRFTFEGGLVILFGVLTLAALIVPAITSLDVIRRAMAGSAWRDAQRYGVIALALAFAHVAVLGWRTWPTYHTWPGGLPPLTALACTVAAASLALRAAGRRTRR